MKHDKRIKGICVLDTETVGSLDAPLVYDFAFTICDKKGKIYHQENYLIEEIFTNRELMASAYYVSKLPKYEKMVETGEIEILPYVEILQRFTTVLYEFDINVISAYNLAFDKRAMLHTHKTLGSEENNITHADICSNSDCSQASIQLLIKFKQITEMLQKHDVN